MSCQDLDASDPLSYILSNEDDILGYDLFWASVDGLYWQEIQKIEESPGSVARRFGFHDPAARSTPSIRRKLLGEMEKWREEQRAREAAPPPEPYVSSIPIATPQDLVAKAPPRAVGEVKVKVKKKKAKPTEDPISAPEVELLVDTRNLPQALPDTWKLGRKHADVS